MIYASGRRWISSPISAMALVSLVVPVYHNAASLPDLLARFQALAGRNPDDRFEFLFVDDGSRDESFAVLQELAAGEPRVRIRTSGTKSGRPGRPVTCATDRRRFRRGGK